MAGTGCRMTSKSRTRYDVSIIGGGPAGLSLAAVLGAAGVRVIVIDRDAPEKFLRAGADANAVSGWRLG
jgi:2-polyprenyl-6-methoxyphenol hydroxylase-like FAD-dependent oxidoreductase